ncbi:uncharacterized protein LOC143683220 [Tamandua tetradactyla]|uniref:uncharacterized protein LOC143683220 n=1 Tax=Tamandua tetradactyla TaxID=48850 RepID=UPI0040538398
MVSSVTRALLTSASAEPCSRFWALIAERIQRQERACRKLDRRPGTQPGCPIPSNLNFPLEELNTLHRKGRLSGESLSSEITSCCFKDSRPYLQVVTSKPARITSGKHIAVKERPISLTTVSYGRYSSSRGTMESSFDTNAPPTSKSLFCLVTVKYNDVFITVVIFSFTTAQN